MRYEKKPQTFQSDVKHRARTRILRLLQRGRLALNFAVLPGAFPFIQEQHSQRRMQASWVPCSYCVIAHNKVSSVVENFIASDR